MLLDNGNLCCTFPTDPKDNAKTDHDDPCMRIWKSPLSIRWHDIHARTCLETPIAALGRLMHSWVATFLDETNREVDPTEMVLRRRLDLRGEIEHFIGVVVPVKNAETAMLACCQWATSIMLKVDRHSIPISKAAQMTRMRPRLVGCLRLTNLSNMWDDRRGMLFWVAAICHRATAGQCFPLLTTALQARFAHVMALSERYHAIGITSLTRLYLFERRCWAP
jgi:hypothetical protein